MPMRPATATAEVRLQLALGTSGALAALTIGALINLALTPGWGSLTMALLHLIGLALVGSSLPLLRAGRVVQGESLLLGGTIAAIMLIGVAGADLEQSAAFTFVVPVAMAALLLPPRRLAVLTASCALLATLLLSCRQLGLAPVVSLSAVPLVVSGMAGACLWLVMLCIVTAQRQERTARQAAAAYAHELDSLRLHYERRVSELQAQLAAYQQPHAQPVAALLAEPLPAPAALRPAWRVRFSRDRSVSVQHPDAEARGFWLLGNVGRAIQTHLRIPHASRTSARRSLRLPDRPVEAMRDQSQRWLGAARGFGERLSQLRLGPPTLQPLPISQRPHDNTRRG